MKRICVFRDLRRNPALIAGFMLWFSRILLIASPASEFDNMFHLYVEQLSQTNGRVFMLSNSTNLISAFRAFADRHAGSEWYLKALFHVGRIYADSGRIETAINYFGDYARQYPDSNLANDALYEAAHLRFDIEDYQHAISAITGLLERIPSDDDSTKKRRIPDALLLLGRSYEAVSDRLLAKAVYEDLVSRFPNTIHSRQARSALVRMGEP